MKLTAIGSGVQPAALPRVRGEVAATPRESFQTGYTVGPLATPKLGVVAKKPATAIKAATLSACRALGQAFLGIVGKGDPVVGLQSELAQINSMEKAAGQLLTPGQFAAKTAELKGRLAQGESLESLRPEAYAVARQACVHAMGMRPYDEQMLGALAMDQGRVAEMKTGEGKTMTAVMPVYLNALAGKGVHVVTANETLAQRDCESMAQAYRLLGLTVAPCLESMKPEEKRAAYSADVTYLTNSTLGFDYLRDRTCRNPAERVQREPFFALVDEVDEVLIDEARVPLIISATSQPAQGEYRAFADLVGKLEINHDFEVDQEKHATYLTETGQDFVANQLGMNHYQGHLDRATAIIAESRSGKVGDGTTREQRRLERAEKLAARAEQMLKVGAQIAPLIRQEQAQERDLKALDKPGFLQSSPTLEAKQTELETTREQKTALQKQFPGFDLYSQAHPPKFAHLGKALEARGLFRSGKDYTSAFSEKLDGQLRDLCSQLKIPAGEVQGTRLLVAAQQLQPELAARLGISDSDLSGNWVRSNLPAVAPELTALIQEKSGGLVEPYLSACVDSAARERGVTSQALLGDNFRDIAELKIVDEFKGRIAEGRRFSDGLHQALEAKEGLQIKPEQRSVASITYPNLFRRYPRLSGMSGTAQSAEKEFRDLYGLEVARIPTHKPSQMVQGPDAIFPTLEAKYAAIVDDAKRSYEEGVPVLIGTRSVEVNREITRRLQDAGVPCQSLNADSVKNNTSQENDLLARAGQSGWVTVATNMAGRGVDIKEDQTNYKRLSLVASSLSDPNLDAAAWKPYLQGLNIDPAQFDALTALSAGKGLPVTVNVKSEKEAERLSQWFSMPGSPIPHEVGGGLATPGVIRILVGDQHPSDSIVLNGSDFPTGGLRVLGTERHASPRIDQQLVGRAGRQGRPGSAQFFVSKEDELLKIYGGDALAKLDTSDARAVSKFVGDCQERIENLNFDSRLETTKFDGVMNKHRQLFYDIHDQVVEDPSPSGSAADWTTAALVRATEAEFPENVGRDEIQSRFKHSADVVRGAFGKAVAKLGLPVKVEFSGKVATRDLDSLIGSSVSRAFESLSGKLEAAGLPAAEVADFQRKAMLDAMDGAWTDHLSNMEDLKRRANLEARDGKEPLMVYQGLAFDAFETTLHAFQEEAARKLLPNMQKTVNILEASRLP